MTEHKYSIDDDHWEEGDQEDVDTKPTPRVELEYHTVVLDWVVDERYTERYRYRFSVRNGVVTGWTRTDIEHNGTEDYNQIGSWSEIPQRIKHGLRIQLNIDDWDGHLDLPDHLHGGDDE